MAKNKKEKSNQKIRNQQTVEQQTTDQNLVSEQNQTEEKNVAETEANETETNETETNETETNETPSKSVWKKIVSSSFFHLFVASVFIIYIMESAGRHSAFGGLEFLTAHPLRYLMNMLLILTPFTVFYLIRNRYVGFVLVGFVWVAIGVINGIVLANRVTPFSMIDFRLIKEALGVIGKYLEIWQMIAVGILGIAAIFGLVWLLRKLARYDGKMHYIRNSIMIVMYWVFMYVSMRALVHAGVFATVIPNLAYAYKDYGVSYCFTVTGMRNGITKPIDYTEGKMDKLMKKVNKKTADEKKGKEPHEANVIFLQLESFFDITHVKNYIFSDDPIPYFTYLREHYSTGYLNVPAFGAGTANTEFETMTGMNLQFFSPGEYPYKTVLKKRTCESVAYDLKELGYSTHAIHNNTAKFYGRSKVFTNLGYDSFSTIETMNSRFETKTGWSKDEVLTNEIMNALKSTDTPDYIYTISVQGHGDYYNDEAQVDTPEVWVKNVTEDTQKAAVNYYVEQIGEMDFFVKTLCQALDSFEEDTVLVLYGDHLPGLGFDNDDLENGDVYQTEYVIWSNFDMKKKDKNLHAYQLAAEVLNRLHIHNGTVIRYHQKYKDKKHYMSNLRALQYDMLYGNQYVYGGQTPFLQTDMEFGVKDVEITSVLAQEEKAVLYGSSFSECSHVFVNGEEVEDVEFISDSALEIPVTLQEGDRIQVIQKERERDKILRKGNVFHFSTTSTLDTPPVNTGEEKSEEEVDE